MNTCYTDEKNTQILIALMKYHKIKKIIVSPGATNVCFVASIQYDSYFELYSAVDERSAAYMACGLAAECHEPVALSCTGATASRNYAPALTEAYYRKLPVLAITSTQNIAKIGHHIAQVIDRTSLMNDLVKISVQAPSVYSDEDQWLLEVNINKALLELRRKSGGPVHINLQTVYSKNFSVRELPSVQVIDRFTLEDNLPSLDGKNVGIYVGAHEIWDESLVACVETFCNIYNGVVFCDQTSNYRGKYRVLPSIVCGQAEYNSPYKDMDIMIHIGEISGAFMPMNPKYVWRVNPDGEVRDTFRGLRYVFEMSEKAFFHAYTVHALKKSDLSYYKYWKKECDYFASKEQNIPFSNIWIARNTANKLPENSSIYFGILNTLRAWNFTETPASIVGFSNTGGFGIDGGLSTTLGAALANQNKLYFCLLGDLGFFYDMNALGNRHIGNNIRIMVINNGCGTEFKNYGHHAARFGDEANPYMAAAGHFGNKSPVLIRHFAEDLGFVYITASSKEEYLKKLDLFVNPVIGKNPIIFEVFTDSDNESEALRIIYNLELTTGGKAKNMVKNVLGEKSVQKIKSIIGKG